jgi:hypothetical protein
VEVEVMVDSPYRLGFLAGYAGKSQSAAAEELFDAEESGAIRALDEKAAEECIAGYEDGLRSGLIARGAVRYTTAPEAYDGFGTITVRVVGTFAGKPLRCVAIQPAHLEWQTCRYNSGLHPCWTQAQFYKDVQTMRDFRRAA